MTLTTLQHEALKNHFATDTYLVDGMIDLIEHREGSACINLLLGAESVDADIEQDDALSPKTKNESRLNVAFNMIGNETKSVSDSVLSYVQKVSWNIFVESTQSVPDFFNNFHIQLDALQRWLTGIEEIPETVRVKLFNGYAQKITQHVEAFYSWIKTLLIKHFGETIAKTVLTIIQTAIALGKGLIKFVGQGFQVLQTAAKFIIDGIKAISDVVSDQLYIACRYTTYCSVSLLEGLTIQDKDSQRYAAKVACFLLGCQEEILSYPKSIPDETKRRRIREMAQQWSIVSKKITKIYTDPAISKENFENFITKHWIFQNVLEWLKTPIDVFNWIIKGINWLVVSMTNYKPSERIVFESVIVQAPVLFTVVFPNMIENVKIAMGKSSVDNSLQEKKEENNDGNGEEAIIDNAIAFAMAVKENTGPVDTVVFAKFISENPEVSENHREMLSKALETQKQIRLNLQKHNEAAKKALYDKSGTDAFYHQWNVASQLGAHLVGDPYDAESMLQSYEAIQGYSLLLELESYQISNRSVTFALFNIFSRIESKKMDLLKENLQSIDAGVDKDVTKTDVIFTDDDIQKMTNEQIITRLKVLYDNLQFDWEQQNAKVEETKNMKLRELNIITTITEKKLLKMNETRYLALQSDQKYGKSLQTSNDNLSFLLEAHKEISKAQSDVREEIQKIERGFNSFVHNRRIEIGKLQAKLIANEEKMKWTSKIIATTIFIGLYGFYVKTCIMNTEVLNTVETINGNATFTGNDPSGLMALKLERLAKIAVEKAENKGKTVDHGVIMSWITWTLSPFSYLASSIKDTLLDVSLTWLPDFAINGINNFFEIAQQIFRGLIILPLTWQSIIFPWIYVQQGGYFLMFGVATSVFGVTVMPAWDYAKEFFQILLLVTINKFFYKDPRAEYTLTNLIRNRAGYFERTLLVKSFPTMVDGGRYVASCILTLALIAGAGPAGALNAVPYFGKSASEYLSTKTLETGAILMGNIAKAKLVVSEGFEKMFPRNDPFITTPPMYLNPLSDDIPKLDTKEAIQNITEAANKMANDIRDLFENTKPMQAIDSGTKSTEITNFPKIEWESDSEDE